MARSHAPARGRADKSDPDRPGVDELHVPRFRYRLIRLLEDVLRIFVEGFPGRSQADFVARPLEKSHTDFLIQLPDLLTQGRPGCVHDFGVVAKVRLPATATKYREDSIP